MIDLVLLRHGQSLWNQEKTFTGWTDIGLSERGKSDARAVGRELAAEGFIFDRCFTSVLSRATDTARLVLGAMAAPDVPLTTSWRLNERHYGALQGLSFWDAVKRFGLARTLRCQRRYASRPPELPDGDPRFPGNDPRYAELPHELLPHAESLHDTLLRVLPFWERTIVPELQAGRRVLVVSHRNLLRALIKHVLELPDTKAPSIKVPTATPLIYSLDASLRVIAKRSLPRPTAAPEDADSDATSAS